MNRSLGLLLIGLALGIAGAVGAYRWRTTDYRAVLSDPQPELAWLQREFGLTDEQFRRVAALHNAYLPKCAVMCERIAATNALIRHQITQQGRSTPELRELLTAAARLRAECQAQMLDYFFAASQAMPPEQGKRYLEWVQDRVFAMPHETPSTAVSGSHHDQ
jgi:hypothetical protein